FCSVVSVVEKIQNDLRNLTWATLDRQWRRRHYHLEAYIFLAEFFPTKNKGIFHDLLKNGRLKWIIGSFLGKGYEPTNNIGNSSRASRNFLIGSFHCRKVD